ncbi:MAG: FAD-binding oxidoreductase, partial [bacterium]
PFRRLVFRGSLGSDAGKAFRWNLERVFGEKLGLERSSRNQLMSGSVALYVNRRQDRTDVLHEYFVPPSRLADFLARAREIVPRHGADLLNVTLRDVRRDDDTLLRYADQDMIALVFFFDQWRTPEAEAGMTALTRELIEACLSVGGHYYLPYRPHATVDQFLRAYPQAPAFFAAKRRYDPGELFQNQFYLRYRYTPQSGK